MCTVLLPPGDNPIAVNKYIITLKHAQLSNFHYHQLKALQEVALASAATFSKFVYPSYCYCWLLRTKTDGVEVTIKLMRFLYCLWMIQEERRRTNRLHECVGSLKRAFLERKYFWTTKKIIITTVTLSPWDARSSGILRSV